MSFFAETAALLDQLAAWHWFTLGVILLVFEIVSTTNYLLRPGIAALLIGVLKFIVPDLDGALSLFLLAVLASRLQRGIGSVRPGAAGLRNRPTASMRAWTPIWAARAPRPAISSAARAPSCWTIRAGWRW